jgi:regulator of CtrA degradation
MGTEKTTVLWLDKTYGETMQLLEEAKRYNAYSFKNQVRHLLPIKRLAITTESLRVTSRLTHTMAWLMTEKAIINDELLRAEVENRFRPLAEEHICTQKTDKDLEGLPNGLVSLIDRSFELFMRASRLEGMLRRKIKHDERPKQLH